MYLRISHNGYYRSLFFSDYDVLHCYIIAIYAHLRRRFRDRTIDAKKYYTPICTYYNTIFSVVKSVHYTTVVYETGKGI